MKEITRTRPAAIYLVIQLDDGSLVGIQSNSVTEVTVEHNTPEFAPPRFEITVGCNSMEYVVPTEAYPAAMSIEGGA